MANEFINGFRELKNARRENLHLFGIVFVFSVFVNILMLTGPLFMLQVYDRVLGSRSEETLVALFALVALLFFLMGVLDYARSRLMVRIGARFQKAISLRVFNAELLKAKHPKLRGQAAEGLRDIETMQALTNSPATMAIFDVPWAPVFIFAIFIFHPILGWLALGGGATLIVFAILNNVLTRRRTIEMQSTSIKAQSFAEESRQAVEIVSSQGLVSVVQNRWLQMKYHSLEKGVRASDWTGFFTTFSKAFRIFLQSAMLAVGAWLVLQGELTAGAMIAGSILLGRALAPIEQTIGQWALFQKSIAGWNALGILLSKHPEEETPMQLPRPEARLTVNAVNLLAEETRSPILSGISFELNPGEALGIIGKSGSGKSTLAKTVLGLIAPTTGEIRLGGATLAQYGPEAIGSHIGYLPQELTLFDGTIAENIARMSQEPNEEQVVKSAIAANAHELILALPEGYQTVIRRGDGQLSGGQKQRIALARALYTDPVLLVLDEPNSALDAEGSDALNRAIRDFKSTGRSVLIMTHRPTAITECDTLAIVDKGAIRSFGPRDEVLRSGVRNATAVQSTLVKETAY